MTLTATQSKTKKTRSKKPEPVQPAPATAATPRGKSRQREIFELRQQEAKRIHEEYQDGFNPDRLSDAAHGQRVLSLLGLEPNYYIEGTQLRVQCGLAALDVLDLAFSGKLIARLEKSRDEVAEKSLQNQIDAEKERLKKKQRSR